MNEMNLKNKLFYFVLLFFPKFVKENDQIISEEIKQYLKEKQITKFYKMFDEEILKNKKIEDEKEECNGLENKKIEDEKVEGNGFERKKIENEILIEGSEKDEITDNFASHLIQNKDDSSTLEKKSRDFRI